MINLTELLEQVGQLATDVKFKKVTDINIYVKALKDGINIDIQEVG